MFKQKMIRIIPCFFLILTTASLMTLVIPGGYELVESASSHSGISAVPEKIDLGVILQGAKIPFTVSIRNNTYHDIHGLSLQPSCGCTLLDPVIESTLGANRLLEVSGVFDASYTRGKKATHMLISWVGEPQQSNQIITIVADVTPIITMTPDSLEFRVSPLTNEEFVKTRHIHLHSARNIPFMIDDLRWTHPAFEVTVQTSASDNRYSVSTLLDVVFNSQHPSVDTLTGISYIHVRTSIPSEPILRIPVRVIPPSKIMK